MGSTSPRVSPGALTNHDSAFGSKHPEREVVLAGQSGRFSGNEVIILLYIIYYIATPFIQICGAMQVSPGMYIATFYTDLSPGIGITSIYWLHAALLHSNNIQRASTKKPRRPLNVGQ